MKRFITLNQYKILALSSFSGILEVYNFFIFAYFLNIIATLFFPPEIPDWLRQIQVYALFSIGFFFRPVGGVIIAHYGDTLGRKKTFIFSIVLMAFPTLAIGLIPTYNEIGYYSIILLLLFRIMQGCSYGGEVPTSLVFVSEHSSKQHINFSSTVIIASFTCGGLLSNVVATFINSYFTHSQILEGAWRYPFILGGFLGVISFFLRRWLQETPVFLSMKKKILKNQLPIKYSLINHRSTILIGLIFFSIYNSVLISLLTLGVSLLPKLFKISPLIASELGVVVSVFTIIGCLIFGILADRFSQIKVLTIGLFFLSASAVLYYYQLQNSSINIFFFAGVCGFFIGSIAIIPPLIMMSFPAKVRLSSLALVWGLSASIFSAFAPVILSFLSIFNSLAPVYYVSIFCYIGVFVGIYLMLKSNNLNKIS